MDSNKVNFTKAAYKSLHSMNGELPILDALTGLPNRALFFDRMRRELARVRRYKSGFALMMLDLDGFDTFNNNNGRDMGDAVLCDVAKQLISTVRDVDSVARTGADEFAILLDGVTSRNVAEVVALKIIRSTSRTITLSNGSQIAVGASAGVVFSRPDGPSAEQMLISAEEAVNVAKSNGKGLINFSKVLHEEPHPEQHLVSAYQDGDMNLGISIMDEQHRAMANYINGILASLVDGDKSTRLFKRLDLLLELCEINFKTEEDLIKQNNLAGLESHQIEHQRQLMKLRTLFGKLNFNEQELAKLHQSVNEWLLEHINGNDTELAAALKSKGIS